MIKRNFFVAEISRIARYALPGVKYMIDNKRLNSLTIQKSMGILKPENSLNDKS